MGVNNYCTLYLVVAVCISVLEKMKSGLLTYGCEHLRGCEQMQRPCKMACNLREVGRIEGE
jgi:hypothetical protein